MCIYVDLILLLKYLVYFDDTEISKNNNQTLAVKVFKDKTTSLFKL